MLYGAIEAGGTKFVCVVADQELNIIEKVSIPTTLPVETFKEIESFFNEYQLDIISIGSFGPININENSPNYGFITNTPKNGWNNTDFLGTIKEKFGIPVLWTTDVNVAAYGEYKLGRAKNSDSCLYLTVGTGIGGGLVRNDEIIDGFTHPEMGHLLIRKDKSDNFSGTCPIHGDCLEGLASGFAIEKRLGQKGNFLPVTHPVWKRVSNYLAQALMTYTLVVSPEKIILGGGVMKQPHLLSLVKKEFEILMNNYMEYPNVDNYINTPELSDNAGIIGCLSLAKDYYS